MIVVTSDSYASYQNFTKGYWFDNKVVDCGAIECNTTYDYSIEEIIIFLVFEYVYSSNTPLFLSNKVIINF